MPPDDVILLITFIAVLIPDPPFLYFQESSARQVPFMLSVPKHERRSDGPFDNACPERTVHPSTGSGRTVIRKAQGEWKNNNINHPSVDSISPKR
jgi:hypothetical protein